MKAPEDIQIKANKAKISKGEKKPESEEEKQRSAGIWDVTEIKMTVRGRKKREWKKGIEGQKEREKEMRGGEKKWGYLPAVRDRFLKKALIHKQLQINHRGSISQMNSCWEYPTAYESLLSPLQKLNCTSLLDFYIQ